MGLSSESPQAVANPLFFGGEMMKSYKQRELWQHRMLKIASLTPIQTQKNVRK